MRFLEQWSVEDVMTSPVKALNRAWTVREAARYLLEHGFSGCPVVDDRRVVVGVLTLKDIARYAEWHLAVEEWSEDKAPEQNPRPPSHTKEKPGDASNLVDRMSEATVGQVMTKKVSTVTEATPVKDAMSFLLEGPMHRIFVTTGEGRLVGLVSTMDLVRFFNEKLGVS